MTTALSADNIKHQAVETLLIAIATPDKNEDSPERKAAWNEIKRRLTRPESLPNWVEQYNETEKNLREVAEQIALSNSAEKVNIAIQKFTTSLLYQAADDIKTLVDGLIYEEDRKPKSDENGMVPIPDEYLPKGVSGSMLDPETLRAHVDMLYRTLYPGMQEMTLKPWVVKFLLDKAGL